MNENSLVEISLSDSRTISRRKSKVNGDAPVIAISSNTFAALEVELLHVSTDSEHECKFGDFIAV